jgi:integrase
MPDELTRLLDACVPHLKPIVLMAVHTGMRVREIRAWTWPQVDVRRRILMLAKTKDQKWRIIPLNDQAIEVLRTLPRHVESPSVFCAIPTCPRRTCKQW